MTPSTAALVIWGPALLSGGAATLALGVAVAAVLLGLPLAIERYNPFGLADRLHHT